MRSIYTDKKSVRDRLDDVMDSLNALETKAKSEGHLTIQERLLYQSLTERKKALVQLIYP